MIGKKEGRWGTCEYFLKDEYVGRSIHNYGEYGPDETEKILGLADSAGNGICLDIGANIGCISQALLANGFKVHAFEPQPQVFELLSHNMGHVSSSAWKAINVAVSSAPGSVKMPKVHYSEKGNFGGLGIGVNSTLGSYTVPAVTLDSIYFGILNPKGEYAEILSKRERVAFIKLDVEGWEIETLKGGRNVILRDRPIMYIEDDRVEKSKALREYIVSLGYTIEEHKPTLYRENNFFGLKKNIWDKNYASHNLICRPC